LYCTELAGHAGPHVDESEIGSITWARDEPLAIDAPERKRPSWWSRLGARVADDCAQAMAWLAAAVYGGGGQHGPDEEDIAGEPGAASGRCDWGDCDEIASEMRWDDEDGWLPVCAYHAEPQEPEPYEPPATQVMEAVKVGDTYLALSGTPAGPWCACIIGCGEARATVPVTECPEHGTLPLERDEARTEIMGAIRVTARRQTRNIWGPPRPESRWEFLARTGVPEPLRYVAEILAAPRWALEA